MIGWSFKRYILALLMLGALSLFSFCLLAAQDNPPEEPDTIIVVTSEPFEMTFGPGSYNLAMPTVGLTNLASYRATLILTFVGTHAGKPEQWSRTDTLLVTQSPLTRQLTIDYSDGTDQVNRAEINGGTYEWQAGGICMLKTADASRSVAASWEPAARLSSVIGAEEAGTETLNNVAATHYRFDERAIGIAGVSDSRGELWVAAEGGYLIRYQLTTTGGTDYFGEGIEGTLTWNYQLSDVNQPLSIELPDDCPPALLNMPLMSDAADVLQLPGFTSYTTPSGIEDVLAFYEELVTASGAQANNPPLISEHSILFGFTQNDQPILLIVSNDGSTTSVELLHMSDPNALSIAVEVPDSRGEETVAESTSQGCEASVVPMLPDAANVQTMMGIVTYTTQTSIEDAVAFYEAQAAAAGGQVTSPMPASNMMAMLNLQQGDKALSVTMSSMGGITNVTIMSVSGGTVSLNNDCVASP